MLDLWGEFRVGGVLGGWLSVFFVGGGGWWWCRLVRLCEMWRMWMECFSFEREGFSGVSFFGMFGESVVGGWVGFFFPADGFSFHEEFLFNFKSKMFIVSNLTILLNQNLLFPFNKNHSLFTSKLENLYRLSPARFLCNSSAHPSYPYPSSTPLPSSLSPLLHPKMILLLFWWRLVGVCLVIWYPYYIAF